MKVYPRVCGGTSLKIRNHSPTGGLSPRVRGNPLDDMEEAACMGSIPACAGEPDNRMKLHLETEVYPRVCGGTLNMPALHRQNRGLSPRVRGNQRAVLRIHGRWGSIPACAGEPYRDKAVDRRRRVYPRVCGGTQRLSLLAHRAIGLSPRVRGNPTAWSSGFPAIRSIPACAGEPVTMR